GMRLGYWFDPRVGDESQALKENPGLALQSDPAVAEGNPFMSPWLVDLAREAGRKWLEEKLERIISQYHGKWIWLDNNAYPRHQYWNYHEEPDRRGLMELQYYQGFYEVFDRVLQRHPDVRVESCANGGMIIDLGTIRRSHAIWVNDWVGFEAAGQVYDIDVNRNLRAGASHWLPGALVVNSLYCPWEVTQSNELYPDNRYVSHFAGTFAFGQRVLKWKQADIDRAAEIMKIYKRFRPHLLQDYYQLVSTPRSRDQWDAWQFHDPEDGSGWIILFRLSESSPESLSVDLKAWPEGTKAQWEAPLAPKLYEEESGRLTVELDVEAPCILHYCF
ncbi:MAG: alpha-galactosidase, partial [Candidatus Sumerlaeota bacterium]